MTSTEDRNTTPVNISKIDVLGVESYNKEYIKNILSPLLSTSSKTIGDLSKDGNKVVSNLTYLGGFESVDLKFDVDSRSRDTKIGVLNEPLINVVGTINAVPIKPTLFNIKTIHTDLGNAIGIKYLNNNVFGNGEKFEIQSQLDLVNKSKMVNIFSSSPFLNTSTRIFGDLNIEKAANKLFESKNQNSTSAKFGILKQKFCKHSNALATLSTGVNLVNRNITNIEDFANDEIKTYAGESVKESIFLNFESSNMKYLKSSKLSLPINGFTVKFSNEIAGLPSMINKDLKIDQQEDQFYKVGLDVDYVRSVLSNNLTILSNFKFGSIINFNHNHNNTINFQDKFYPKVSGFENPIMPLDTIGSGSFLNYNLTLFSKAGLINSVQPLRFYTSINGVSSTNELNGLKFNPLLTLSNDWKNGLDVGLIYSKGDANARLFWKKPIFSNSNKDIGKFGFEIDISGKW